jgi:ribosomal protein L13
VNKPPYLRTPNFRGDIICTTVDTLTYKTISANKENAGKQWLLVDAEGQTLGRLASEVAKRLRGKHKTNFTPHADCGDYVVVINAEKVVLTGNKWDEKEYIRYTGYPGSRRSPSPSWKRLCAACCRRIASDAKCSATCTST